ncbi:hypothetical protein BGW38_010964 [Lunasporangiospora selenospora]|uniref:Male-enhanced antigen 1 n=1 Tax=Lunasporangiospora selenospora TaxID=979761 RepID=A0A9P6KF62_9FUNG|nr:hypothetical protein BGW38_010964 [Lunasporangiospora selenospora]
MQADAQDPESGYDVSQEQLDAVDRMLEELDMDERFDRVPSAFRIVDNLGIDGEQQDTGRPTVSTGIHSHHRSSAGHIPTNGADNDTNGHSSFMSSEEGAMSSDEMEEDDADEGDMEPFGYIPLDQGDGYGGDYNLMQSDDEDEDNTSVDHHTDDNENEGQGYDGYLHETSRDGSLPVPTLPSPVQIEVGPEDSEATAQISDEDLRTIVQVMSSFSLPAPEWAQAIPEEKWLPTIVQRASTANTATATDTRTATIEEERQ